MVAECRRSCRVVIAAEEAEEQKEKREGLPHRSLLFASQDLELPRYMNYSSSAPLLPPMLTNASAIATAIPIRLSIPASPRLRRAKPRLRGA